MNTQVELVRSRAVMFQSAIDKDDFVSLEPLLSDLKNEFMSVYRVDPGLTLLNAQSIRTMLRINLRYRFVPLHQFGLQIEI